MTYTDLPLFRATDPETSRQVSPLRVGTHRAILLEQYYHATLGLTDEEAGMRAALAGHDIKGYWKRCSDLRTLGLIEDLGIRRALSSGSQGIVCAITQAGLDMVRGWTKKVEGCLIWTEKNNGGVGINCRTLNYACTTCGWKPTKKVKP